MFPEQEAFSDHKVGHGIPFRIHDHLLNVPNVFVVCADYGRSLCDGNPAFRDTGFRLGIQLYRNRRHPSRSRRLKADGRIPVGRL